MKPAILPRVSDIQDAQIKTLDAPSFRSVIVVLLNCSSTFQLPQVTPL